MSNRRHTQTTGLRHRVRDRAKPPLVIVPITLAEPAIVEIAGFAGAEAVLLDCEHGFLNEETVRSMLAHARSAGTAAVFRPRSFDAAACRQALDAGAAGVHVSHVDTEEEARAVVEACRYAPLGRREMSLGRAIEYDVTNIPSYVEHANESELLVVMIESMKAVENAEKIAAVEGIDVIHIGVADLSHEMGLGVTATHPRVIAAVDRVLAAAKPHGVAVGFPTDDPKQVEEFAAKGVRYFEATTPDYLLRETYAARLAALRKCWR